MDNRRGFTLIELLVVMVIIGILASVGLPALKGMGKANRISAANRQVLDDLSMARMRAINDRTTVYLVFVGPNVFNALDAAQNNLQTSRGISNLLTGQFTSYAMVAARTVGDQPGQFTPRYISDWKSLPDGMLFAPFKYDTRFINHPNEYMRAFETNAVVFPNSRSSLLYPMPMIAFNSQGQLIPNRDGIQRDEIIPVVQGSIFYPRDNQGNLTRGQPDVQVAGRGNTNTFQYIRVDWLTGRARVEPPPFR